MARFSLASVAIAVFAVAGYFACAKVRMLDAKATRWDEHCHMVRIAFNTAAHALRRDRDAFNRDWVLDNTLSRTTGGDYRRFTDALECGANAMLLTDDRVDDCRARRDHECLARIAQEVVDSIPGDE